MKKFSGNIPIKMNAKNWYDKDYKKNGINSQRRYPNEEFTRFMGRNFFSIKKKKRKQIKILETGCGTGGNLWMISKEGFSTYGIDFSKESIKLCKKFFKKEKLKADFMIGDFTSMKYERNYFNSVVDVFSSCILNINDGRNYIKEVNRILKKNGVFFSYFPSKKSEMFNFKSRKMHDKDTMITLTERCSHPRPHALRFMTLNQYCLLLIKSGFKIRYKEEVMRTYFSTKEKFYFLVIEASKINQSS